MSRTSPPTISLPVKSSSKSRARRQSTKRKIFVLDTNVLLHDPTCLYRFEEHDVYLPIMTLEELDNNKKGLSEIARNARQVSRMLDDILYDNEDITDGIDLQNCSHDQAQGKLLLQTEAIPNLLPQSLPTAHADNHILSVVLHLQKQYPGRLVILVSKDINMRIKARTLGLQSEDYFNDKVFEDTDLLYSGARELPVDFWETHSEGMSSWKEKDKSYYRVKGPLCLEYEINQFIWLSGDEEDVELFSAQVKELGGKEAVLEVLTDFTHSKHSVWGINARNREQNFALNLLMNPDIDFVSIAGQAGTGKTLLTLAAGLAQVLDKKLYSEIIFTRVTVPVGEDIGFLPGSEEEKMTPWMGALEDNLEVLTSLNSEDGHYNGEWSRAATGDLIHSRVKIKSLNFMRGRTFLKKFLIIDEAQNLTPKQMRTLITRAGSGSKVICLGNLAQIDTPYLTEGSSGLSYVIDRFKGWAHAGHILLRRGERSRLAERAAEVL